MASFITSYARLKTISAAQTITDNYNNGKSKAQFVYADTDSLHIYLNGEDADKYLETCGLEIDSTKLGAWDHEGTFKEGKFLRQKCYIEKHVINEKSYNKGIKGKEPFLYTKDDNGFYFLKITVAGMPSKCYNQVTFKNFKIGATYNIWKKDFSKALNPIGYVGMNYGCAPRYKFNIENYPLSDSYWGSQENNFNATGHTSAHWGEFLLGVRAPVAQNFCLGFEVMLKLFLNIKEQNVNGASIRQTYAPGFGDKETGKWGFRYTVGYFFPTVKRKKRISSDEE
jgi:hypothetical protein